MCGTGTFFKTYFAFNYVNVCISVCEYRCPIVQERVLDSLEGDVVTGSCELLDECWERNSGP